MTSLRTLVQAELSGTGCWGQAGGRDTAGLNPEPGVFWETDAHPKSPAQSCQRAPPAPARRAAGGLAGAGAGRGHGGEGERPAEWPRPGCWRGPRDPPWREAPPVRALPPGPSLRCFPGGRAALAWGAGRGGGRGRPEGSAPPLPAAPLGSSWAAARRRHPAAAGTHYAPSASRDAAANKRPSVNVSNESSLCRCRFPVSGRRPRRPGERGWSGQRPSWPGRSASWTWPPPGGACGGSRHAAGPRVPRVHVGGSGQAVAERLPAACPPWRTAEALVVLAPPPWLGGEGAPGTSSLPSREAAGRPPRVTLKWVKRWGAGSAE